MEEGASGSPLILRRLAWMVVFLVLVYLSFQGIQWYADRSESPALGTLIERAQDNFAAARRQMHALPIRRIVGSSDSARGRELRQRCEELGTAFVASPQLATRELMLQYCQAYEHYRETGELPRDLPDPGR